MTRAFGKLSFCATLVLSWAVTSWAAEPPAPAATDAAAKPALRVEFENSADGTEGQKPVKAKNLVFVEGKTGKGLLVAAGSGTVLSYATAGRITGERGCIEFWLRPKWSPKDQKSYGILQDSGQRMSFQISQWKPSTYFTLYNSEWKVALQLESDVSAWKANEWHHIKLDWDVNAESQVIIDGKVTAKAWVSTKGVTFPLGGELFIGTNFEGLGASDAVYDDLVLSAGATSAPSTPSAPPAAPAEAKPAAAAPSASGDAAAEALRKAGVYAFDFGPADVTPRNGFARVGPAAVMVAGSPWGWARPVLTSWARREKFATGKEPVALEYSLVEGEGANSFQVMLADGAYRVWLLTGDLGGTPPAFAVSVNGKEVVTEQQTINFIPRIQTWQFDAQAANGALTLDFRGAPRFVLGGCVIAASANWGKEAGPVVAAVEKDMRLLPPDELKAFTEKPFVETNPPPTPTAEQTKRGFLVFTRPCMEPVYPNTIPAAGEIDRPVSAFATPGEYEPLTFGLYPLRKVQGLTATVSDLVSENGKRIGQEALVLRIAQYRAHQEGWGSRNYRIVPELLERLRAPVSLDETKLLWLTVHVPADAAAGVYAGKVTLSAPESGMTEVPVSLTVLPFTLPLDTEQTFAIYYNDPSPGPQKVGGPVQQARGTSDRMFELRRRDFEDMREHGIQTVQAIGGAHVIEKDGQTTYDASAFTEYMEAARKAGVLRRPTFGGAPDVQDMDMELWKLLNKVQMPPDYEPPKQFSDKFVSQYIGGIKYIQDLAREHGWPEIMFYPVDEPSGAARRQAGKMLCRLIRQVPGARVFVTGYFSSDYLDEEFAKLIDVVCFSDLNGVPDDPALRKGNWYYPNTIVASCGDAPTARFGSGFGFAFSGLAGWAPWRYAAWQGNPESALDSGMTDFFLSLPTGEEHVPTLRGENVREGVDDCRYLTLLNQTIALAEKSGRAEANQAATEAKEELQRMRRSTPTLRQFAVGSAPAAIIEMNVSEKDSPFDRVRWCSENVQGTRWTMALLIQRVAAATRGEPTAKAQVEKAPAVGIDIAPATAEALPPPLLSVAPVTAGAVKVDGVFDEPCWRQAHALSFVINADGTDPKEKTEAMIVLDEKSLYLAFTCRESNMAKLARSVTTHDGANAWNDDCVEVFIQPKRGVNDFYHVIATAGGGIWDAIYPNGEINTRWNSSTEVVVKQSADQWQLEMRIPRAEVGLESATVAGFNLCREEKPRGELSAWSPTGTAFDTPARFGRLILSPAPCYISRIQPISAAYGPNEIPVRLVNNTANPQTVRGVVRLSGSSDPKSRWETAPIAIEPRGEVNALLPLEAGGAGNTSARADVSVELAGKQTDRETLDLGVPEAARLDPTAPYALRGRGLFRVTGRIRLSEALRKTASMEVSILGADGARTVVSRPVSPIPNGGFALWADPATLPDGRYRLQVSLRPKPGAEPLQSSVEFLVEPGY